jgi:hypothetical protein
MNNMAMTGRILADLIEIYIDALNKGAAPDIMSAWDNVIESEI